MLTVEREPHDFKIALYQDQVFARSSHYFDSGDLGRVRGNNLGIGGRGIDLLDRSIDLQTFADLISPDIHIAPSPVQYDYGRTSYTKLNGVSVARRKCENPPFVMTSRIRASPAWAPNARPTSCDSDAGVQSNVEAE